jgi:hypothetical protein
MGQARYSIDFISAAIIHPIFANLNVSLTENLKVLSHSPVVW